MSDSERVQTMPNGERVSLRDYVDSKFEAIEKQREASEKTLDARLESMNQFRAQITDQARTFVTKIEYDTNHRYLENDVRECMTFIGKLRGMATQNQVLIAYALAVIGMLVGFVGHFLK